MENSTDYVPYATIKTLIHFIKGVGKELKRPATGKCLDYETTICAPVMMQISSSC